MHSIRLLLALASAFRALGAPLDVGASILKEIISLPSGWSHAGVAAPDHQLKLTFALKQGNIQGLLSKLDDVADPSSPNYRKWLTQDEVNTYSAPEDGVVSTVKQWLSLKGVDASTFSQPTVDTLQFSATVAKAEELLSTTYSHYTHANLPGTLVRSLQYSLPQVIAELVDTVQPTTAFYSRIQKATTSTSEFPPSRVQQRAATVTCNPLQLDPQCFFAKLYVDYTGHNRGGAQVAAVGLGQEPANHADAAAYDRSLAPSATPFIDISAQGSNNGNPDGEGNLDTQLISGLAKGNQAYYISVGGDNTDSYTDLVSYLQSGSASPAVSISYAGNEDEYSPDYLTRICNGFAQAAAMGITVFVASGDQGVSGINDASQPCTKFIPTFPATCPYVTVVGGVDFVTADKNVPNSNNDPGLKAAWFESHGGTGGGFSNFFAQGSWQKTAVNGYISKLNGQYKGQYNASGRAYPDVASFSDTWWIVVNGGWTQSGGTSASAPSWAAMASLFNDYNLGQNKKLLGWLNPTIYKAPANAFFDITINGTRGCDGLGFPALTGWDAATGLGAPKWTILKSSLTG